MNKKAFTLLELLVVAAVIGVIAAMLLPALGRAREGARRALCASNLRQIGMALHMYCDDYDGFFPASSGDLWYRQLAPYLEIGGTLLDIDQAEVYRCPTPSSWFFPPLGERKRDIKQIAFNMNMLLQPSGSQVRLSNVQSPSDTICVFDAPGPSGGGWQEWGGTYEVSYGEGWVDDRHSNGANILWVDGHVSWHLKTEIVNTTEWWYP